MVINEPKQISTEDFLAAFYPEGKGRVYLRLFDDRGNGGGRNMEIDLNNFNAIRPTLEKENKNNNGIFFVVNGTGQTDAEVKRHGRAAAQFMEIDDRPFPEQLEAINAFPLEPSIVVRTRKSLHCYWLLNRGKIEHFREVQTALAEYFGSDSSIKNESRVMRLPGFNHCKSEPVRVEIVHFRPELRYEQIELARVLPRPKREPERKRYAQESGQMIPQGRRVQTLVSKISKLTNEGFLPDNIRETIGRMNAEQCNPPLSDREMNREVYPAIERFKDEPIPANKRGDRYLPHGGQILTTRAANGVDQNRTQSVRINQRLVDLVASMTPETRYSWNDKGNGELFADVFKNTVRFNVTAKEWYQYTGKIWKEDTGGMKAAHLAKELTDALMIYSTTIQDDKARMEYQKYISCLGRLNNRKSMVEDAREKYCIDSDVLDANNNLLNLQNGVLDLTTGEIKKHSPEYLLSKICNAAYVPGAKAARWEQFIEEVTEGDASTAEYLQKILGYALTAETKEETCYILYGQSTRNGKSTLVETIAYMMGNDDGYALNMRPETLAQRPNDTRTASGDIARLKGCRFLNASEPPKRMVFSTELLKVMLGRDKITARHLYQRETEFVPSFKLFMNTNYLPLINDDTVFSSGRINVIPFTRHFEPEEQDKALKDKLRAADEISGILNWCLDGLRLYRQHGADAPEKVRKATEEYRAASDKVGTFFGERMDETPGTNASAKEVYNEYVSWCRDNGYGQENKGNFFADLRLKGLLIKSGTVNGKTVRNVVPGYSIAAEFETPRTW